MRGFLAFATLGVVLICAQGIASARSLSSVSDLIGTSIPSTATSHIITFTAESAVPASGFIRITPRVGAFSLESGFDYTDMDIEVSSGGPFMHRELASVASLTEDGVSIAYDGTITIELNQSTGLLENDSIRVTLGTDASHGSAGNRSPVNPSTPGSYRILIETLSGSSALIDSANAMISVNTPVSLSVLASPQPPVRVNGLPSGDIAAGNSSIQLSFQTNEEASCRYATTPGVAYGSMTNQFQSTSDGMLFYVTVGGHANDTTYTYYVRCIDTSLSENTDDYEIEFTLAETPISNTSIPGPAGTVGRGGVGPFPDGSDVLYLAEFKINGWAPPSSRVTTLKDGVAGATAQAGSDGKFQILIGSLERGVYTFSTYAEDSGGRKTSSYSTTMMLESGTSNVVSDILLPPTIAVTNTNPAVGESVDVDGASAPSSSIDLTVSRRSGSTLSNASTLIASSSASGAWVSVINGARLAQGTYVLQARARVGTKAPSPLSSPIVLNVGETIVEREPTGSADINGDGKVNLIDFSIMLSNWLTDDAGSDINADSTVNLADFSILLFNWTG